MNIFTLCMHFKMCVFCDEQMTRRGMHDLCAGFLSVYLQYEEQKKNCERQYVVCSAH